jgi:hypothetical protein
MIANSRRRFYGGSKKKNIEIQEEQEKDPLEAQSSGLDELFALPSA